MNINLIEFFIETTIKNRNKIAVIDGAKDITFGDLDIKARALAQSILQDCLYKNEPIALYLPKSIDAVISDIAITYSGNIYMNLDVKNPEERILNILALIKPRIIITNMEYYPRISKIVSGSIRIINIDNIGSIFTPV